MTYNNIKHKLMELQEELINLGFIELIAPVFFLNTQPTMTEPVKIQQASQFVYLISMNEEIMPKLSEHQLEAIMIQQLLHACREAADETLRWRILIKQVNHLTQRNIPDKHYSNANFERADSYKTGTEEHGHLAPQVCIACGYKKMIPFAGVRIAQRTLCPMCEQDTCIQVA